MLWWRQKIEFHLLEILGEGGQGRVYRALRLDRSSGLSQAVAVKILHSRTAVEVWRSEFESLARVRSPYCVQVLSFERVRGKPALVLELVEGVSGAELLEAGALSEAAVTEAVAQIQCGLIDLAHQGLFHGDLNPHNILIDVNGNVRLLDFGLANGHGKKLRLTPSFAAPERLKGAMADFASDLFSLGRIEQYWRGLEPSFEDTGSYLRICPGARKPLPHQPDPDRQRELALAVRKAQRRQKLKSKMATESYASPKPRSKSSIAQGLVAALMLLVPVFFAGAAQSKWRPALATLQLKTENWHFFYLDGQPVGYAPLNLVISADQDHRLAWIRVNGRGSRTLRLQRDHVIQWRDRDFLH